MLHNLNNEENINMNTTAFLPTPPTSGAIVQSGGGEGYGYGLSDLITNNNIADNSRAVLGSISNSTASIIAAEGVNTVAAINATSQNGIANMKATGDSSVATQKAVGDSSVSTQKSVYDGTVSTTKAVTDAAVAGINATSLANVSIIKAITDSATASAVAATASAIAAKDTQIQISEDGCKTRDQAAAHFAALQKDMFDAKYEALRNKCELEAKLAECCCELKSEHAATRALVLSEGSKRIEAENADLRMQLLLSKAK